MNCDPNLCIGDWREFNHELVKIRTKLACSNLKKSQTTMFTLLLHRSITLCRIEFSNISVKYSNVNFQCQLPLSKYLTQNGTFKSTNYKQYLIKSMYHPENQQQIIAKKPAISKEQIFILEYLHKLFFFLLTAFHFK